MEERDRSCSPSRRTSRVEQVVGRWLRRSRDSTSRERVFEDGCAGDTSPPEQRSYPIRVTVQIPFDPALSSYGFTVSTHNPPQVQEVSAEGPADGRLLPGDQLIKINSVAVDDLSAEQVADIIRECQETITMTVLRITVGPKSSFITPEKRAKLRSNPVKVRFAEEVVVSSHSQGNSLLFLPNVLKVYLENGQTKAFKFEPKTTVKDIVMTLKEKLSISHIEHFALVLEQQYSITKLFLLHEEELIQEVVQKEESHDYRCLFRVCFIPKEPERMLMEDPVAFEYLYLQSVSDVLQERFAVEMKCNTALRLAALNIQERLASTGQITKPPLKSIMKDWGIESFVSNTLLRNMREKDLRKAISFHMKKLIQEPKHKVMSVNQARLNYLKEMAGLKSYGGKSFTATMMLQDRESMVSLLVGAQYGVSHVINHKLSVMATLTDFRSISRVELLLESERVSLVKIYMQDIKPITLLLESVAAKELSCLVAGYCKLLVDPQICVFPWTPQSKSHRMSAEEGYVSRCGSDSEDSDTDVNTLPTHASGTTQNNPQAAADSSAVVGQEEKKAKEENEIKEAKNDKQGENGTVEAETVALEELSEFIHASEGEMVKTHEGQDAVEKEGKERQEKESEPPCLIVMEDPSSDASDSCRTESHFLMSMSSDSIDALEEDDLLTYCCTSQPSHLDVGNHYFQSDSSISLPCPGESYCQDGDFHEELGSTDFKGNSDSFECFAALSSIAECLPSPPEASEDEDCEKQVDEEEGQRLEVFEEAIGSAQLPQGEYVFTFEQGDARCYYNICCNVTPDSAHSLQRTQSPSRAQSSPSIQQEKSGHGEEGAKEVKSILILQPPPGFGDSSSDDDEFFDAQDRFDAQESSSRACKRDISTESDSIKHPLSLSDIRIGVREITEEKKELREENKLSRFHNRCRKRRSFMETDYTSLVSFPEKDQTKDSNHVPNHSSHVESPISCFKVGLSNQSSCRTVSSLTSTEGEPVQLESKPITPSKLSGPGIHNLMDGKGRNNTTSQRKQQVMLMEPESMEVKSVTELVSTASSAIVAVRTNSELKPIESNVSSAGTEEGAIGGLVEELLTGHLFFATSKQEEGDKTSPVTINDHKCLKEDLSQDSSLDQKSCSLPQTTRTPQSSFQAPATCYSSDKCERSKGNLEMGSGKCTAESKQRTRSQSVSAAVERKAPFFPQRHLLSQRGPLIHTKKTLFNDTDKSSKPSSQEQSYSVPSAEPVQSYLLAPYSSGILGRLSASTLRGKIQKLPLYLSRSQEVLTANVSIDGNTTTTMRSEQQPSINRVEVAKEATEDVSTTDMNSEVTEVVSVISEEITEVIEEVSRISQANPQLQEGQKKNAEPQDPPQSTTQSPSFLKPIPSVIINPSSKVVTTKTLNGTWGVVTSQRIGELQGESVPPLTSGCGFLTNCESKPTCTQPHGLPSQCVHEKAKLTCSSALAMGCETVMKGAQTPMEVCGCHAVYTNCFSGALNSDNFDDELTVYEFSCRTEQSENGHAALMTSPSSLSGSPSFSPSSPLPYFPRMVLPPSSSVELGPLLSPLDGPDCFMSYPHEDAIVALLARRYPLPPMGFLDLQRDVDTLLTVLAGATKDQDGMQEHHREACADHFSENKRRLHVEARGLLAGCQHVVRVGQTPTETLQALSESFNSLVQLTSVCLSFSSCQRCHERHIQALAGLAGVAQSYREFAQAAEHVGTATGKRTCQDLSVKLLARKCTALTTSVFCLTQLFRTLTAL